MNEPSEILFHSVMASMQEYYQSESNKKTERGIKMEEKQSATQLLKSINTAIEEWFQAEIRAYEGAADKE